VSPSLYKVPHFSSFGKYLSYAWISGHLDFLWTLVSAIGVHGFLSAELHGALNTKVSAHSWWHHLATEAYGSFSLHSHSNTICISYSLSLPTSVLSRGTHSSL
jgi:hypothetical protein